MNRLFGYNNFINENVQAAKALLKKLGKETTDPAYKQIIQWLGNATGYTHWFVKQHFVNSASLEERKQIIDTIKADKAIIDKFTTPVIQLENCEKFWDEYLAQSRNTEAKAAYNEFPARQKRLLDLSNSEDIQMLKDLWTDTDKKTFLKKLASYTNRATLLKNLKNFLYQKTSKVTEELLTELKKAGVNIVYADVQKEIIITTVNYSQIVKFCSDTSWCIVRSEGMFNSYVNYYDYFTLQFVIFLPGRSDRMRKIGVTRGAGKWVTAHDVRDGHVNESSVYKILEEYDVEDSENIFLDEVKKHIEKGKINFDTTPVQALLAAGISKETILKTKEIYPLIYRIDPTKTDLSFFTKEEIDEYDVLDKKELILSDLNTIDLKEIVKRKLWRRINGIKFSDIITIGSIDYETAKEIARERKFNEDQLARKLLRRKRETLLREINKDRYFQDYELLLVLRTKEEESKDFSANFEDFSYFLKKILRDKEKSNSLKKSYFVDYLSIISDFYKLTKERLESELDYLPSLLDLYSEMEGVHPIVKDNKVGNNQNEIKKGIKEIISEKIVQNKFIRPSVLSETLVQFIDPNRLEKIKAVIKNDKLYDEVWTKTRNRIIQSWEVRQVLSRLLYKNDRNNPDFEILEFWKLDSSLPLSFWKELFGSQSSSDKEKILNWMIKIGYDVSTDEFFEFCEKTMRDREDLFWIFCLKNNIGGKNTQTKLIEKMEKGNISGLEDKTIKEIRELLDKENSETFMEQYYYNFAKNKTNIFEPDWLQIYYQILKLHLEKTKKLGLTKKIITALAALGQKQELESLELKVDDLSTAKELTNAILGSYSRYDVSLSPDAKELVWQYLNRAVKLDDNLEKLELDRALLVCAWSLGKKDIVQKYLDKIKTIKDNEQYYGRSLKDGIKKRTNKVYALVPLLRYLEEENDYEGIKSVLSNFKLTKFEKRWASSHFYNKSLFGQIWNDEKNESFAVVDFSSFLENIYNV